MTGPDIRVLASAEAAARAAAAFVAGLARESAGGQAALFTVALSGGSTPRLLYRILASPPYAEEISWGRWEVFWGDERCVPPDHGDSNYRMAWETLLDHVPIPADRVHRMRGEASSPQEAAEEYERELRRALGGGDASPRPVFDLVLLGLGDDGHTASLFPDTDALGENDRLVVANWVPALDAHRLTLTLPVINAARHIIFLVAGRSKAAALRDVLEPSGSASDDRPLLPAGRVRPDPGALHWFVDRDAASLLTRVNAA